MDAFERKMLVRQALSKIEKIAASEEASSFSGLTAAEIGAILSDRELRMQDNANDTVLGQRLMADTDDPDLQRLFALRVREHISLVCNEDPFYGNYPPAGTIVVANGDVFAGTMPTGDPVAFPLTDTASGIAVIGATGSGKTEFTKALAWMLAALGHLVIVIDRKRQYRDIPGILVNAGHSPLFDIKDLRLALFQPPMGVDLELWANDITQIIASCYRRLAAHRLFRDLLGKAYANRAPGTYPSLAEMVQKLAEYKTRFGWRESDLRESMLSVLKDLLNNTGEICNYCNSDFLEKLFARPGIISIEAHTLPVEHFSFLVTYLMRWIYVKRLHSEDSAFLPVDFVLEDATTAIQPKADWDSPSGVSPLTDQIFMQRSYGIGVVVVGHTLGISELMLKNLGIKFLMGLHGEDPRLVQRVFGLTPEQCELVRELRPGEFIALVPSVWPMPVYATFSRMVTNHGA